MRVMRWWSSFVVSLTTLALAACETTAMLAPAPQARAVPGLEGAAIASAAGVRVVAQPDVWPGKAPIQDEVTPVRVRIENRSGEPLLVRPRQFMLVAPDGTTYAARSPAQIRGTVRVRGEPPRFIGFDPRNYMYRSIEYELPTEEMRALALRAGVLPPGQATSGFLYFERLSDALDRVSFRMDLVNPQDRRRRGAVTIPFRFA